MMRGYSRQYFINTLGYNLTISSTPLGKQNLFYEIFNDKKQYKDYKRYSLNIYEAKKQGFNVDIESIKRISMKNPAGIPV
jgi:hypothetical protein